MKELLFQKSHIITKRGGKDHILTSSWDKLDNLRYIIFITKGKQLDLRIESSSTMSASSIINVFIFFNKLSDCDLR